MYKLFVVCGLLWLIFTLFLMTGPYMKVMSADPGTKSVYIDYAPFTAILVLTVIFISYMIK
jgi:hypothetical protein